MSRPVVLSSAALNRATLARQLFLERAAVDPVAAAGAVGGLQAQEPASPFIALWTRLEGLDAGAVRTAFEERRLVKATLMRGTLHAVPAADYRQLAPAMAPLIDGALSRAGRGPRPDDASLARFRAAAVELAATPRRNSELRDLLAALEAAGGTADAGAAQRTDGGGTWWWIRRHVPLVHAPVEAPWSFERRPWLVAADAWLTGDGGFADATAGTVHLLRRYLGAFGPATIADAASWSRLQVALLRPVLATLEAAGELVHLRDEAGRALVDLVGAARPDETTPAPPRLLPMWDSVLLGHADRSRIVAAADRARVVAANGDTYPTFLVDGRVAGLWWAVAEHGRTRIELEPFRELAAGTRHALEREAEALAAFVEPHEPDVYRRYRGSRDRRVTGTIG
ncbi:MAG TPA: winged helix DNA-binding domain-containing protein [Candidatus Limnocylindrales bacterium]|nr:winged helix DNA-binding domain-containing protein [Candidatus Limnocylindrales bacterium]